MSPLTVDILEERWTPTTIQTAFVFQPPSHNDGTSNSDGISINLPLLNLGWTFGLSLTPDKPYKKGKQINNWIPAAFSFRQHASTIRWENTSIHAELSLDTECPPRHTVPQAVAVPVAEDTVFQFGFPSAPKVALGSVVTEVPAKFAFPEDQNAVPHYAYEHRTAAFGAPYNKMNSNMTPFAAMKIVLVDTPSSELPLETSSTISSLRSNKVWLTVTVSECPFQNGLFGARFSPINEAQVQAQLVKQSGDRLLRRSLTTGKLVDVKFMAPSARPASGNTGESLPTYALLSVLEAHINHSSSMLRESWANALACLDNFGAQRAGKVLSPKGYEYDELDSDFEDEDEGSYPPRDCDLAALQGQQSESSTERSSNSLSSFGPVDGASDQASADNQLEELFKGSIRKESPTDYERTIWIQFAAHRTWLAFLWYCYTGNLEFGKLKSQVEPGGRHLRVTPLEGGPSSCSPKSMYRLADLLGNQDLKAKALAGIKERMTEVNVVDEVFSVFTSRYPDVREAQLGVLKEYRGSTIVKKSFLRAMGKYEHIPHAESVLSAFYDKIVV